MSETEAQPKYLVRDAQGNVYGPADGPTLREWVGQGRIVAGMDIAPRDTREWVEVSRHPVLADLFPGLTDAAAVPVTIVTATPSPVIPIATVAYENAPPAGVVRNRCGFLAMIFGIVAPCMTVAGCIPMCGCVIAPFGVLSALVAVVLGIIGLAQIRAKPEVYDGKWQAVAGLVLGSTTLFLLLLLMIVGLMFKR